MYGDLVIAGIPLYSRYPEKNYHPNIINWGHRVRHNGGNVSNASMIAVNRFYKRIEGFGIADKMQSFIPIVPDNIIAATTPIGKYLGSDPWTIHSFVVDPIVLSINGITGSVPDTFYLGSGVVPLNFIKNNSVGLTVYIPRYTYSGQADFGCTQETDILVLYTNYGGSFFNYKCIFDSFNNSSDNNNPDGQGRIQGNPLDNSAGYFSANRLNSTDTKIYTANSFRSHYTVASGNSLGGNSSGITDVVTLGKVSNQNWTNRLYSFAAIHDGLTEFESNILYNAVQHYRFEIGGGYA